MVKAPPTTPCNESGNCAVACKVFAWALAFLLLWFSLWNVMKLPELGAFYYTNVTWDADRCTGREAEADPALAKACRGVEIQATLQKWADMRGFKLITDEVLFVGPHVAMGVVLELLFATILFTGFGHAAALAKAIIPLAFLFALHITPVANGFPTRKAGVEANWILVIFIWLTCASSAAGLLLRARGRERLGEYVLFVSIIVMGVAVNTAPMGEWAIISTSAWNSTLGAWVAPEGDRPHPLSGHDAYSKCKCPAVGWLLVWLVLLSGAAHLSWYHRAQLRAGWAAARARLGGAAPTKASRGEGEAALSAI